MAKTAADIRRQIAAINKRSAEVFTQTIPRKIERALTASAIVVGNKALYYTPVEFAMLANSQYREVRDNGAGGYFARIGYTADYAAALHERTDWSPRPPEMKKGPAWNPRAKPGFLFEAGEETKVTVRRIMLGDLKL